LTGAATSFSEGAYAAAAFDACFVNSFVEADELLDETVGSKALGDLVEGPEKIGDYSDSLWAELYYAHSLYNWQEANRTNEYDYKVNAVKLQRLANCLAAAKQDMVALLEASVAPSPSPEPSEPVFSIEVERGVSPDSSKWFFFAALVFLVGGVAFLVLSVHHKIRKRGPALTPKKRLELLDDLLLEQKVSESTYKRLRKKYAAKKK